MAKAVRSLSPKQIAERTQLHRQAVMVLARLAAKRAVQDNLRAQGVRLTVFPIAELMRQAREYLSAHPELYQLALAEFERHLILARTSEGRQRAQARGVRFGRKPKLTAHQQQEALARRATGEALVDIARSYAVSHSTISRLA